MRIDNKETENNKIKKESEESFNHLFKTIASELRNVRKGHVPPPSLKGRVTHHEKD